MVESNVEFLGRVLDKYKESVSVVPFVYNYSAWNRLKEKLMQEMKQLLNVWAMVQLSIRWFTW